MVFRWSSQSATWTGLVLPGKTFNKKNLKFAVGCSSMSSPRFTQKNFTNSVFTQCFTSFKPLSQPEAQQPGFGSSRQQYVPGTPPPAPNWGLLGWKLQQHSEALVRYRQLKLGCSFLTRQSSRRRRKEKRHSKANTSKRKQNNATEAARTIGRLKSGRLWVAFHSWLGIEGPAWNLHHNVSQAHPLSALKIS